MLDWKSYLGSFSGITLLHILTANFKSETLKGFEAKARAQCLSSKNGCKIIHILMTPFSDWYCNSSKVVFL